MKKSLKIVALVAAMAATMSAFASCNNNNNSSTGGNSSGSSTGGNSSGSSTGGDSSSSSSANNGPAPTIKWFTIGGQPNDLEMVLEEMNRYSEEKINVKCDLVYLDWNAWDDRTTAILNSGEPFDIMFAPGGKFQNGISIGGFAELEDLLKEVPDLYNYNPEALWDGVTINGHIYGVPTYKDSSDAHYWIWDKKYVEKYNVDYENIHSLEQMEDTVKLYQDAINKGEITITQYAFPIGGEINGFTRAYDGGVCDIGVRYDDADAKVVRIFEQPDLMNDCKRLHEWYEAGYINPDAPTCTAEQLTMLIGSGQGFPTAEIGWGVNKEEGAVISTWEDANIFSTGTIQGSINCIAAASNNKVEALKYLELVNLDPVMRNMLAFGIEGTHYIMNDNGTITRDPVKKDDYGGTNYAQGTFFTLYPLDDEPIDKWDQVKANTEKATASVLLGFSFDRTPVENEIAACSAIGPSYTKNIKSGAVDPETAVAEYYAAMEAVGLAKIEEELQRQVDAFLGK